MAVVENPLIVLNLVMIMEMEVLMMMNIEMKVMMNMEMEILIMMNMEMEVLIMMNMELEGLEVEIKGLAFEVRKTLQDITMLLF